MVNNHVDFHDHVPCHLSSVTWTWTCCLLVLIPSDALEHSFPGGVRAVEDAGHRQLRPRYARPAQSKQNSLCNENFRQTKG